MGDALAATRGHYDMALVATHQPARVKRGKGEVDPAAPILCDDCYVRRYRAGGITQGALGHEFGVDSSVVSRIVNQHAWQHLAEAS